VGAAPSFISVARPPRPTTANKVQREVEILKKRTPEKKQVPQLVRLEYGAPFCELCKETIPVGGLVGWWQVVDRGGRKRSTAYCEVCHHRNLKRRRPLR
jgi:hypothetical protein